MRKLDYEFIFTCGIVAFIAALGMVAGIVVLAGAKIYVYNLPLIVGSFLAIGGLLWGLLLSCGYFAKEIFKIMLIHASMIRKFMKIVLALNSYHIYQIKVDALS